MILFNLKQFKLPNLPGVYFFKKGQSILYIGKATSLKDRVRSYLNNDILITRGPLIEKMLFEANKIDFIKTDSVLEALILEADLIKKHQPRYNSKEKDDKSFNYIVITKEDFPQILIKRSRELNKLRTGQKAQLPTIKYIFGPFPQGNILKEALKIIRKIFPFKDDKCKVGQGRPCFNRQINLCPGVCTGEITKTEYNKIIYNIKLLLENKKKTMLQKLEKEMKQAAKELKFEKANKIKKTIFALRHIQDIALIKSEVQLPIVKNYKIEAYDIAHLSGTNVVGAMTVIENGEIKKNDYRKFKITQEKNDDIGNLKELLERRFKHNEWKTPNLIVVDGGTAHIKIAQKVLKQFNLKIPVIAVTKNEHHKPKHILGDNKIVSKKEKEILIANHEAHRFAISYNRKLRKLNLSTKA